MISTIRRLEAITSSILFLVIFCSAANAHSPVTSEFAAMVQGLGRVTIVFPDGRATYASAPVELKLRFSSGSDSRRFRAFLNGRDITTKFARVSNSACIATACDLRAIVLAEDGLQKGLNELHLEVVRVDFTREEVTRRFSVAGPKADAGPDLVGTVGHPIPLNSEESQSGTEVLTHSWELVRRPEGSQARIDNANAANPILVADINGMYTAKLEVHDGYFASDPDLVDISVSPSNYLIPIQTGLCCGDDGSYSIKIGVNVYRSGSDSTVNSVGLQMLALNSGNLELIEQGSFYAGSTSSFAPIKDFLDRRVKGEIVIISSTHSSGIHNKALDGILTGDKKTPGFGGNGEIGGVPIGNNFTFIGVKGYAFDQAFQSGYRNDHYVGHFLQDSRGSYKYFQRDFVKFQIKNPAQPNTITIGSDVHTAAQLPVHAGGFQLVVYERVQLTPLKELDGKPINRTYATGDPAKSLSEINRMAQDLTLIMNTYGESALFFVSSIGKPLPPGSDMVVFEVWNDFATTNHATFYMSCRDTLGNLIETSSPEFVIGHQAKFLKSVSCPANYPDFSGTWRWTHTGSGDHARWTSTFKGFDNQTVQTNLPIVMSRIGANPYLLTSLRTTDTYALVGAVRASYASAPPASVIETSSFLTPQTPEGGIRGLLGRNHRVYFEPSLVDIDIAAPISHDLVTIAWTDPVAWPATDTLEKQAAYRYISQYVACGGPPNPSGHESVPQPGHSCWLSQPVECASQSGYHVW